jgi:hypothetical protein
MFCSCFVNREIDYPLSHAFFFFLVLFFFPISTNLGVFWVLILISLPLAKNLELFLCWFLQTWGVLGFLILISELGTSQNLERFSLLGCCFCCWVNEFLHQLLVTTSDGGVGGGGGGGG